MLIYIESKKSGFTFSFWEHTEYYQFLNLHPDIHEMVKHMSIIPGTIQVRNNNNFQINGIMKDQFYDVPLDELEKCILFSKFKEQSLLKLCSAKLINDINLDSFLITGYERIELLKDNWSMKFHGVKTMNDILKIIEVSGATLDDYLFLDYWKKNLEGTEIELPEGISIS